MENNSPLLSAHYVEKANHFLQGMKMLAEDLPAYRTSVALLAIHSAISFNDAILAGIKGQRSKADDHSAAARELLGICRERRLENTHGVRHLTSLLSSKSDVAYGEKRIDDNDIKSAMDKAERFANWAYLHFKEALGARRS